MSEIRLHERIDDLHCKGYKIIQSPDSFCFGMDAVLLSGFVKIKRDEKALDLCTGTGIIPILLSAKTSCSDFSAIEIQPDSVDMAVRSVRLNGLEDRIRIVAGDVRRITEYFKPGQYHVVTANPPYMNAGGGVVNQNEAAAIARHELLCSLEDVVAAGARMLKNNGRFYMVHRPHRVSDIICTMRAHGIEPKNLRFVHPYAHKKPILLLVEGIRNGQAMTHVLPPLVLYTESGVLSEEVQQIYGEAGT